MTGRLPIGAVFIAVLAGLVIMGKSVSLSIIAALVICCGIGYGATSGQSKTRNDE